MAGIDELQKFRDHIHKPVDFRKVLLMTNNQIEWNSDIDKTMKYEKQRLILEGSHDIFSMSWSIIQKSAYRTFNQMGINMNLDNNVQR